VEIEGVQFAADQEAALFVPAERGARIAQVPGKGRQVMGGVGEFQDAGGDEI
jgi:hypothetical protein